MRFYTLTLLILHGICVCKETSGENGKNVSSSLLDVATYVINKAKENIPERSENNSCGKNNSIPLPVDCSDLLHTGHTKSGVYTIFPRNRLTEDKPLHVFCNMDTNGGGWTVIQRRGNFNRPNDYFFKNWESYKKGFGDITEDFWLGNDNIFALTNQKLYSVRFDLEDVEMENRYANYDSFWIDDEFNNYTLHISDYSGDAGDSFHTQNNQPFSTKDRGNDNSKNQNCADYYKSAWWYNSCYNSDLNGIYRRGKHEKGLGGIHWSTFKGVNESLETTEIMIRPAKFFGIKV